MPRLDRDEYTRTASTYWDDAWLSLRADRERHIQRVIDAFESSGDAALERRAMRMRLCCSRGHLRIDPVADDVRIAMYHCDDRMCPTCHSHRTRHVRARLARRLKAAAAGGEWVRFATLTIGRGWQDDQLGPRAAYDYARKALRRLYQQKTWTDHVRAGFGAFELTYRDGWHPHWHLLLVGDYWPQAELAQSWTDVTLDSPTGPPTTQHGRRVVDIRAADAATLYEITKYTVKHQGCPGDQLVQFATLMRHRQFYRAFGEWNGDLWAKPSDGVQRYDVDLVELVTAVAEGRDVMDMTGAPLGSTELATRALRSFERQLGVWSENQRQRFLRRQWRQFVELSQDLEAMKREEQRQLAPDGR